jgi:hypothetical protein
MLDDEVAAGREDLLPIPALLHRPGRREAAPVGDGEAELDQIRPLALRQPIQSLAARTGQEAVHGEEVAVVAAAMHGPAVDLHAHRPPVDARLEIGRVGDVHVALLRQVAVRHREGDDGADVARAAVAEDVAHPDFAGGDEQILGDHVDVGASGEDEPAGGMLGGAVVGTGGRREGQSGEHDDRLHGPELIDRQRYRHPGESRGLGTRSLGGSPRDPGLRRDDAFGVS